MNQSSGEFLWKDTNFQFLAIINSKLAAYAGAAEKYVFSDPNTSLIKAGQFCEVLTNVLLEKHGVENLNDNTQGFLIKSQWLLSNHIPREQYRKLNWLRRVRNMANHDGASDDSLDCLKRTFELAVWFYQTYGPNKAFPEPIFKKPTKVFQDKDIPEILKEKDAELIFQKTQNYSLRTWMEEDREANLKKENEYLETIDKLHANEKIKITIQEKNAELISEKTQNYSLRTYIEKERKANQKKENDYLETIEKLQANEKIQTRILDAENENALIRSQLIDVKNTLEKENVLRQKNEEELKEKIARLELVALEKAKIDANQKEMELNRTELLKLNKELANERSAGAAKMEELRLTNEKVQIYEMDKKCLQEEKEKNVADHFELVALKDKFQKAQVELELKNEELEEKQAAFLMMEAEKKAKEIELEKEKLQTTFVQSQLAGLNQKIDQTKKIVADLAQHGLTKKAVANANRQITDLKPWFLKIISLVKKMPWGNFSFRAIIVSFLLLFLGWFFGFFRGKTADTNPLQVALSGSGVQPKKLEIVECEDTKKYIGKEIAVKMPVKSTSDRLSWAFALNSKYDFREIGNFQVLIEKSSAVEKFKLAGVYDLKKHFIDNIIMVNGLVEEREDSKTGLPQRRIIVRDPGQIKFLKQ